MEYARMDCYAHQFVQGVRFESPGDRLPHISCLRVVWGPTTPSPPLGRWLEMSNVMDIVLYCLVIATQISARASTSLLPLGPSYITDVSLLLTMAESG